jgi:protein-S-isoprenylcysteine O-methyltransferase Ste14
MIFWNIIAFAAWLTGPFIAAGTLTWVRGWIYFSVLALGLAAHQIYIRRNNPELVRQRQRIGAGTKRWDLIWVPPFWSLMAAVPIVAGLGVRWAWETMPTWVWPIGVVLLSAGLAISAWAMSENPHFEGTARIQREREHRVVASGPYRYIRHPGYVGLGLWALAMPPLLLSRPAVIPAGAVVAWLVLRTVLEDSMLQRELAGYAEYARRVRYRMLPGVW